VKSSPIQKRSDDKLPSQESLLAQYAQRLGRVREGRRAVHIHLSRLQPYNRRDQHIRVAVNTFELLVKSFEGQLFLLANCDIVFACKGAAVSAIDDAVMRLRYLFHEDPLTQELNGENERFCTWYDLERDYDGFLAAAQKVLADEEGRVRRLSTIVASTAEPPERAPIGPRHLGQLVESIVSADLSNLMRRQAICAIAPGEAPRPVLRELYISIAELRDVIMPGFNLASDRWLFQHLTQTLDQRMLKLLLKNNDSEVSQAFSINMNVSTLLSQDFLRFDTNLRSTARGTIVLELQLVDIFADLRAFAFARDFVKERGYRLCIDSIDDLALPYIDRERMGVDIVKLAWQPGLADRVREGADRLRAEIDRIGKARFVMIRCDSEAAIEFGRGLGILLFQGRHVDKLLAAPRAAAPRPPVARAR
jgi:hypothetical protein